MSDGGWPVDGHHDFFAQLDGEIVNILGESPNLLDVEEARALDLAAGRLYASCMEPLERVRQPMRDEARRNFLENNAEEVRAVEELADRLIGELHQN